MRLGAPARPETRQAVLNRCSSNSHDLLLGFDDRDDAFLSARIGGADVLDGELVDDLPGSVPFDPFDDPGRG